MLWIVRCMNTLGVMLGYENNYGLDAYTYFLESKDTFFDWSKVGFGSGTANIGLIAWYIDKLIPGSGSFHAMKVIFSLFGFIGTYLFYKSISVYTNQRNLKLLIFLGIFPSILFWSSIVGKDPVIFFGISLYCFGVLHWLKYQNPVSLLIPILGVILCAFIRPWSALILTVPTFVLATRGTKSVFSKIIYLCVFGLGFFYSVNIFIDHFGLMDMDDIVRKTNAISKSWNIGGSKQDAPNFYSVGDVIRFAPTGMFTALFRPLFWEVPNFFGILAGIENCALLFFAIIGLFKISWKKLFEPATASALSLILTWSFIYGYISYQNLGGASRFRLQILPILLLVILRFYQSNDFHSADAIEE